VLDDLDVDGLSRRFLQAWMGHAEAPKKSRVENRGVGFLDTLASRRLGGRGGGAVGKRNRLVSTGQ
jgi:hypothetical protein